MNWLDRRTDVWTMKLRKATLITPRGKKVNGTHKFGLVKDTLMEPRSQAQILIIRISNGTFRHPNLSVMNAVMLDATFHAVRKRLRVLCCLIEGLGRWREEGEVNTTRHARHIFPRMRSQSEHHTWRLKSCEVQALFMLRAFPKKPVILVIVVRISHLQPWRCAA